MINKLLRSKRLLVVLSLCATIPCGCRMPQYAYRARVVEGASQPAPGIALAPTPMPALPGSQSTFAQPVQPQWSLPQPGGPQPVIPAAPGPVQSNRPTTPPALVSSGVVLEKVGPSQATVGAVVTYRIEIQAASGGAREVTVHDQLASGLTYASSTPMATIEGNQLAWRLGSLRGGELRTIEVNFRAEKAGEFNNCAVARTAEGQTSQDCVSTAVLVPELDVRVRLSGSDTVMVGDRVTFEIDVTNRTSQPVSGLMITDHFDSGLKHDAAVSPIEKDLGQLAGGQSTTIGVTFQVMHAGRLCNRVEVRGESGARGSAEGCVTAMMAAPTATSDPPARPLALPPPPETSITRPRAASPIELKVSGPDERLLEEVAEFSLQIKNTHDRPLTNLTVMIDEDASLKPVQATDGYEWDAKGHLVWKFPTVQSGESRHIQFNVRCQKILAAACIRVKVTSQEGFTATDEACVDVRPEPKEVRTPDTSPPIATPPVVAPPPAAASPPAGKSELVMTIDELTDPVKEGIPLTYEIRVVNKGTATAHNVALLVILPDEMSFIPLGTMGDRTTFGSDGNNIRFKAIDRLEPSEKLAFRVRAKGTQAGEMTVEARVKSDELLQPISETEKTTVLARGE